MVKRGENGQRISQTYEKLPLIYDQNLQKLNQHNHKKLSKPKMLQVVTMEKKVMPADRAA